MHVSLFVSLSLCLDMSAAFQEGASGRRPRSRHRALAMST